MNKGGIGVGSASIVLVFSVLCLTVFSLITFVVAGNDKALVDAEAELITGYYEADALAMLVFSDIISANEIPPDTRGIKIETISDTDLPGTAVSYMCPVSEQKALFVNIVFYAESYRIQSWKMIDTDEWVFDDSLNVWTGE